MKQNRRIAVDLEEEEDQRSVQQIIADGAKALHSAVLQSLVYVKLSKLEVRKRKGSYCLALFSVMLVVFLTALMLSVLGNVQILFLRLGEDSDGQIDLNVVPGGQVADANSLNYTRIQRMFPDGTEQSFHSPRIVLDPTSTFLVNFKSCDTTNMSQLWGPPASSPQSCSSRSGCVRERCTSDSSPSIPVTLYAINVARESRMGLGASWPFPLGPSDIVLDDILAAQLHATVGDTVILFGDVSYPLMQAYVNSNLDDEAQAFQVSSSPVYTSFGQVIVAKTVVAVTSDAHHKIGTADSSYAFVDFDSFVPAVANGLSPDATISQRTIFSSTPSADCASEVNFNFPPNLRNSWYLQTDFAVTRTFAIRFISTIVATLGFNQIDVSTPILTYLNANRFFSLFLGLIIAIIITALSFLSIVLIYSLLSVNIQTRTFELGVMRMVGFPKVNLTGLVIVNALFFAIPAWAIGLVLAQLAFLLVRAKLSSLVSVDFPPTLVGSAVGYATLAGIGIPLLASIAPCFSVLSQSLPEALDTDRGRISAIQYKVSAFDSGYLNFTILLMGTAFTIFGFLLYTLFPVALLSFNISLLFFIFFAILLGMLAGLVLLSLNFERVVETFVSYLFLFWEESIVFTLIQKNLSAHRPRNRKTTLMYALSLGFIIFITVAFSIQLTSIEYQAMRTIGAGIRVSGKMTYENLAELDLFSQQNLTGVVPSTTWVSASLASQIANNTIMSVGRYFSSTIGGKALCPNFYDITDKRFLSVRYQLDTGFNLVESLYTADGSGRLLISTSTYNSLALDSLLDPFLLVATTGDAGSQVDTRYVKTTSAVLDASPVIVASQYPNVKNLDATMSLPSMVMNSAGMLVSIREVQMGSFILTVSRGNANFVQNMLAAKVASMGIAGNVTIRNVYRTQDQLTTANTIVTIFFTFTQVMAMSICFFALISSMSTNVFEQCKEIGILRCIGMHRFPMYRVFVWEAFVLVTAASFLGLIVGTVVAYTMMLQNILFTQLPLPFQFPYVQLIAILIVSLITAFIASVSPVAYLLNMPSITHILRRAL